ncbi:MAG: glutathione peroxidase [Spirochaetales bacterium]|nr:glutathione peroxidase [Spirochaetales bacterium]
MSTLYEFTVKNIDGQEVNLGIYKNKIILIVNVASKCGFTPQYKGLQQLYDKYKESNFVILGFPANNFLKQEPGNDEEIKNFCTLRYNVTFPMFSKISVKGKDIAPLYKFLTEKESNLEFHGTIAWNFTKFLIDPAGKIVARFEPKDTPDSRKVMDKIEQLLNQ